MTHRLKRGGGPKAAELEREASRLEGVAAELKREASGLKDKANKTKINTIDYATANAQAAAARTAANNADAKARSARWVAEEAKEKERKARSESTAKIPGISTIITPQDHRDNKLRQEYADAMNYNIDLTLGKTLPKSTHVL
tara:strand:- start:95 stop:520 length:426 start_codon:yes stop_codon:yes gene_type:complete